MIRTKAPIRCARRHSSFSAFFILHHRLINQKQKMEPDVSIESSCMIRVAVLPIGTVPPTLLRDYNSMLLRHQVIPLSASSSFYTEHQKSPFTNQPWDTGSLRFKFVLGGAPPSPWEDFQCSRKILAVIGICHCPSSPDIDVVVDEFNAACRSYNSALVKRCFAFSPCDSHVSVHFFFCLSSLCSLTVVSLVGNLGRFAGICI